MSWTPASWRDRPAHSRLIETQALDLAAEAARLMRRRTRPASHAA